jgi:hypothetical protein
MRVTDGDKIAKFILYFRPFGNMRRMNLANIKFLIFIAFASGVLTGCINTEGTLKIKGKVLDESTKTGIPWKNIIVQGLVNNNNKSELVEAGQFSTDSSGCFTYSLRKIKGAYNYNFCFIGNSDYPVTINKVTLTGLKSNAKYLFFSLSKLADLTIKINRKSRTPVRDTLRLIWESNGVYGLSLYPYKIYNYGRTDNSFGLTSARDLMWIGGFVNSTLHTKVFADKRTKLSWELFRNGKRQEFTDTITCKRDLTNIVKFTY